MQTFMQVTLLEVENLPFSFVASSDLSVLGIKVRKGTAIKFDSDGIYVARQDGEFIKYSGQVIPTPTIIKLRPFY